MKDNGVIPKSDLNVVSKQDGDKTILTVTSKKPEESFVLVSAKVTPGDLKEVFAVLRNGNNAPVELAGKPVSDSTTPTVVRFTEPTAAKSVEIRLTSSTDKPTNADLDSIVACIETKEDTTPGTTVPSTTAPTHYTTATSAPTTTAPASEPCKKVMKNDGDFKVAQLTVT